MGNKKWKRIAEEHLWVIDMAARGFQVDTETLKEMKSAGRLALCLAAQRYRPGRAKFSSYAYKCVKGAMLDVLKDQPDHIEYEEAIPPEMQWWEVIDGRVLYPEELLILYERLVMGYTIREIARELRVREGLVRSLERKALAKIPL